MMPDFDVPTHAAQALERDGYAVVQDFLETALVERLARDCRATLLSQPMQPAAVGRAGARRIDRSIRGDHTQWLDTVAPSPPCADYLSRMLALRRTLNRELLLGLDEFEAHYALYPTGARYARHRDRFRDDDARVVSSVLYLNGDWRESDGGALRLHLPVNPGASFEDIYPVAGKLVLFLSAEFDHEVLPAARERLSIAGWFRRRAPG
jgi:SM-20-related protein